MPKLLAVLPLALLQACVYVPRTREVYDAGCQVVYKQMVMESVQMRGAEQCTRSPAAPECLVAALGSGFTVVASAVVSGSIVIAGNTLYWLEKQGSCRPAAASPA